MSIRNKDGDIVVTDNVELNRDALTSPLSTMYELRKHFQKGPAPRSVAVLECRYCVSKIAHRFC